MRFASQLLAVTLCAWPSVAFEPVPPGPLNKTAGSFLGISVLEIDSERAKALNLKEERGVEVTRVEEESPAAKGGLKVGDVVLEYNGQRVEGVAQFIRMVQETPAGREVKMSISRSGGLQTLAVKTGARKSLLSKAGDGTVIEIPRLELPDIRLPDVPRAYMSWRSTVVGIEAESLDSQLAEYFGVKEGVLVRSVVKGSAAERAGLKAGDVIVKIDESRITTPREISSSVRTAGAKKTVPVQIVRERREMNLTLAVEDPDPPHAIPRRSIR
jgi:serine protease Do